MKPHLNWARAGDVAIYRADVSVDQTGNEVEAFDHILRTNQPLTAIQASDLPFVIRSCGEPVSSHGKIAGQVQNRITQTPAGNYFVYKESDYYGIIASYLTDLGGGVLVFEVQDSRYENVIAQETGGFIVTR